MSIFTDIATLRAQLENLQNTVNSLSATESTPYLPLSGGTLTGAVYTDNTIPNDAQQLASKYYVDLNVNNLSSLMSVEINNIETTLSAVQSKVLAQTGGYLSILGGTITGDIIVDGNLFVNGSSVIESTNELMVESNNIILNSNFTSGIPNTNVSIIVKRGSDSPVSIMWNESTDTWQLTDNGIELYDIVSTQANTTIFNPIFYANTPQTQFELINKIYVDTWINALQNNITNINNLLANNYYTRTQINNSFAALTGASFTGETQCTFAPISQYDITNKLYVDTNINNINNLLLSNYFTKTQLQNVALPVTGGELTGDLILSSNTTNSMGAVAKNYVDTSILGAINNILNTSSLNNYLTTEEISTQYLSLTGGTINGTLLIETMANVPTSVVSKDYVDTNNNNIISNFSNFVSINGGTIDGALLLSTNSTLPNALVNKSYVDNSIETNNGTWYNNLTSYLPLSGGVIDGSLTVNNLNTTNLILDGVQFSQTLVPVITQNGISTGTVALYETLSNTAGPTSIKNTLVVLENYSNVGSIQDLSFPIEYNVTPAVINNLGIDINVDTTGVTIGNSTLIYSGTIIIMGI